MTKLKFGIGHGHARRSGRRHWPHGGLDERAAAAMALTCNGRFAMPAHQAPDIETSELERS